MTQNKARKGDIFHFLHKTSFIAHQALQGQPKRVLSYFFTT